MIQNINTKFAIHFLMISHKTVFEVDFSLLYEDCAYNVMLIFNTIQVN